MSKPSVYRRSYLIDKDFQYGLIRRITFLAIFFAIFSMAIFLLSYHQFGQVMIEGVAPLYDASHDAVEALKSQRSVFDLFFPVMSFCLFVIVLTTVIYGIFLSHRMAGPIYRIKTELHQLSRGEAGRDAFLRKKDEFVSVITEVNAVKQYQRDLEHRLEEALDKLENGEIEHGKDIIRTIID